jgi:outer membrane protein insertion porin family
VKEDLEKLANKLAIRQMKKVFGFLFVLLVSIGAHGQIKVGSETVRYDVPKEYEIGGITVSGSENFDTQAIVLFSGLVIGKRINIPGDEITRAIKNLWKQRLFSDIQVKIAETRGDVVFLNIEVTERQRLSRFKFEGTSKGEADDLREKIKLIRGTVVNENLKTNTTNICRNHFIDKGFLRTKVEIIEKEDTLVPNSVLLIINVNKGKKVKIQEIVFEGVNEFKEGKLRKAMKDTKQKGITRIFSSSKFIRSSYAKDKKAIISKYNTRGYRNARILNDSVYDIDAKHIGIYLSIAEGNQFYFRNITWVGNTKYSSEELGRVLDISKGEVYDQSKLESRLYMNPNGGDVSSLYLDDGYLAFTPNAVEVLVQNDSIDVEIRLYEGRQYRINKVKVTGNTKTNDHVVLREIRTRPGDLFSRSDIIRTQRELAQLGYFDPEQFDVNPVQNDREGTVDLEYGVVEKPSDQIELSGGWGAGRIVGTLGVSFTNFSLRNLFNTKAWRPLPAGDGQRLSARVQSNGIFFQAYNASFTEPWLGGRKPTSLTVSLQHSVQTNGVGKRADNAASRQALLITGATVGIGKRLQWPDDYFQIFQAINYQYYTINNFGGVFAFADGYSNNLNYTVAISRNSIDNPLYPRSGSNLALTLRITPPFSAFSNIDYETASDQEKYLLVEYHKWKFTTEWFTELAPKLVLRAKAGWGFLGYYNSGIGPSPFERFYLGGSALSGFQLDGREIIALRGYTDNSLSSPQGNNVITKYTLELRYPISLNPSATIYALGFAEAGNSWINFEDYNPMVLKRSVGFGLRIFLPMFGLMGIDYGFGLDPYDPGHAGFGTNQFNPTTGAFKPRGQFHFTIGMDLGEL